VSDKTCEQNVMQNARGTCMSKQLQNANDTRQQARKVADMTQQGWMMQQIRGKALPTLNAAHSIQHKQYIELQEARSLLTSRYLSLRRCWEVLPLLLLSLKLLARLFNLSVLTCQLCAGPLSFRKVGYEKEQVQQCARPVKVRAVLLLAGRERTCPLVSSWPGQSAVQRLMSWFSVVYFFKSQKRTCGRFPGLEGTCAMPAIRAAGRLRARAAIRALSSSFCQSDNDIVPIQSDVCIVAAQSTQRQL